MIKGNPNLRITNNLTLEEKKEYNSRVFNLYREYGYRCNNNNANPIVFPASGVSHIKNQEIFNVLFEGLNVSFVHYDNPNFPESTALEVGGEFIGWMPQETANKYVKEELPRGYHWEGIIKYIYRPNIDDDGKVIKNAGVRIELVPKKYPEADVQEMLNKLSKKYKDNYTLQDIEKLYSTITSDNYYYNDLYDTKTILNAINILLKNNINIEDFHNLFSKKNNFQSVEDLTKFLKKIFDISENREESFYNLIQKLVHFEDYSKISR